ncbi:hypothetical protein EDB86DRAFT_2835892 [Lactarius hatsudake]|nr:hypothetical protein EDB86DRAFT_2835892 [Lactarius hatsudake]
MSGWRGGRWWVAGCCAPCRGGVGVSGGWQGVARRVGVAWGSVAGGGVLHAVSGWRGGRWRLGLVCRVEVVWWVGGSGMLRAVLGWRGGGLVVGVLCAVLGWWWRGVASHVGAVCWGAIGDDLHAQGGGNILQRSGRGIASHVGAACWGGDEWRWLMWLTCTRGRQWPAVLKPWGWSVWNNGVVVREESFPGNESTTHIPMPQIKPPLDTTYHILSHTQTPSLVDAPPLPLPRARELPPFVPTPTRRPDMARNTPPPPTRRHCQPAVPP